MTSRLSEPDQTDAQRLQSRRVLLAFRRGSDHHSLESEPRPGRALLAGVVLAAFATLVAGVVGLVRGGPPDGWDREGNVVLDGDSGTLYLVDGGALRRVANETSLRLAFPGGVPEPVRVGSDTIATRPPGAGFGRADLPPRPPRLLPADTRPLTCTDGGQLAVIMGGPPPPGGVATALVTTGRSLFLITGERIYPLGGYDALGRLGYPGNKVLRRVPPEMLAFLKPGPPMQAVRLPARRALPRGTPPWLQTGARVVDAGTRRSYVVINRVLHPVLNETALRLVYGTRPPGATRVPSATIRAQRVGEPIGNPDQPASPPALTDVTGLLCISDRVAPAASLPISGMVSAPVPAESGKAAIWTPPDAGVLLAASDAAKAAPSVADPVLLVAQGRAFPVDSAAILRSLGYAGDSVLVVPKPWLDQLPLAEPLTQLGS